MSHPECNNVSSSLEGLALRLINSLVLANTLSQFSCSQKGVFLLIYKLVARIVNRVAAEIRDVVGWVYRILLTPSFFLSPWIAPITCYSLSERATDKRITHKYIWAIILMALTIWIVIANDLLWLCTADRGRNSALRLRFGIEWNYVLNLPHIIVLVEVRIKLRLIC